VIGGLQRGELRDDPVAFVRQVAEQFSTLSADHIIVDCGSGRWPATVATFAEATVGILVTTPEPAALESVYLFAESYLRWCLVRALTRAAMGASQEPLAGAGRPRVGLPARRRLPALVPGTRPHRRSHAGHPGASEGRRAGPCPTLLPPLHDPPAEHRPGRHGFSGEGAYQAPAQVAFGEQV